jgi:hypothetical protein
LTGWAGFSVTKISSVIAIGNYGTPNLHMIGRALREEFPGVTLRVMPPALVLERLPSIRSDLVVFDWDIGFIEVKTLVTVLREITPDCMAVAYSRSVIRADQAKQAGMNAYIKKPGEFASLREAIRAATR